MRKRKLRMGCAGGYLEGRLDPGLLIAKHGGCDYLGLEALNEASLSVLQRAFETDPAAGYHARGVQSLVALVGAGGKRSARIATSIGGANPAAGAHAVQSELRRKGLQREIAFVEGDNLTSRLPDFVARGVASWADGQPLARSDLDGVFAASAYLGGEPIARGFSLGADVVVTGRVVDSALYLGPAMHEFGWTRADVDFLASASIGGHLLECAGHLVGGNYWGPGWKRIDYRRIGHGIGELGRDGRLEVTKLARSSGLITRHTVAQQLLYEIGDPSRYILPDVVANVRNVALIEVAPDRVRIDGVTGAPAPKTLKVLLSKRAGFIAEGLATFTWPDALLKAERARDSLAWRLTNKHGLAEFRIDLLGAGALTPVARAQRELLQEVVLRVAAAGATAEEAGAVYAELANFYDCAPAGACGISGPTAGSRSAPRERIDIRGCYVPQTEVRPTVQLLKSRS
jgi:hypothetical protein